MLIRALKSAMHHISAVGIVMPMGHPHSIPHHREHTIACTSAT